MLGSIDFATACAGYLVVTVLALLVFWMVSNFRERPWKNTHDPDSRIWECSICTHIYVSAQDQEITVCPLCKSYNKLTDSNL